MQFDLDTSPLTDENRSDTDFACLADAAPYATEANYIYHPEHGWVKVLDGTTNIEYDTVDVICADPQTNKYLGLYRTWHPDFEILIIPTSHELISDAIAHGEPVYKADEIVEKMQADNEEPPVPVITN